MKEHKYPTFTRKQENNIENNFFVKISVVYFYFLFQPGLNKPFPHYSKMAACYLVTT